MIDLVTFTQFLGLPRAIEEPNNVINELKYIKSVILHKVVYFLGCLELGQVEILHSREILEMKLE